MGGPALAALSLLAKISIVPVTLLGILLGTARAQTDGAPDTERYTLRAEVGLEYDSNAHRTEMSPGRTTLPSSPRRSSAWCWRGRSPTSSPTARSDAGGDGGRQDLRRAGRHRRERRDRPVVAGVGQGARPARDAHAVRRLLRSLPGSGEEADRPANDATSARSRRRAARLDPGQRVDLSLAGGYRWLVFKPDRDDDFNAPTAAIELRWTRPANDDADWEAAPAPLSNTGDSAGPALVIDCPPIVPPGLACSGPDSAHDEFLMTHLDVQRVGHVLIGAGYAFHLQPLEQLRRDGDAPRRDRALRHLAAGRPHAGGARRAALRLLPPGTRSAPRPSDNSFSSVREHRGREPLQRARRSVARAHASACRLVARYTFYANELGSPSISYRRQTMLLSVTGALEK